MKKIGAGARAQFRSRASLAKATASAFAILAATPFAATPFAARAADEPPQAAQAAPVEEVVVTGSRIVRNGYEAPTPVTVVGAEQLQDIAKPNVFDAIATMPAFAGNTNLASSNSNISMGTGGSSTLNLRGLGVNRTLVLFDGRRFPDTFVSGGTDAKLFPDLLISRVDVVTGGASAVYGSDAVSGVVNFVLDKDFVGMKGNVMGGVTGYGDHREDKIEAAAGMLFAGDRGHFLINADYGYEQDMNGTARAWNTVGYAQVANPNYTATNGQPQLLARFSAGLWQANPGGVITSGPLKGIAFGPGGTPYNFVFGPLVSGSFNVGGPDWPLATEAGANSLSAGYNDKHLFGYSSYDVTDNVQVFAQYNFGTVNSTNSCCWTYYLGSLNVSPQNPFMPASIAAQATALGLTSLAFGKQLDDIPEYASWNQRNSYVYTLGGKGNFNAFDTNWKWDFYAQRGLVKLDLNSPVQVEPANFALAIDAVRNPTTGAIVCRSTLTNPTNGCVPYNLFGTPGVNSQAALNYITGSGAHPHNSQAYGQSVTAANVSGEPFSDWAGPISVDAGVEWRKTSIQGTADAIAQAKGWFSTNYISWPYVSESVAEGNAETVIPLAKDTAWAKSLDFNGAVRFTDYSVSGEVVTWKAGLTYSPIDDFRLRATQSRDIRAPNLNDLYAPGQFGHGGIIDPFQNNITAAFNSIAGGNPALKPEKADTTGIGGVYQPSWFPGFSTSVDYYSIKINGAIASPTTTTILNSCFAGVTSYCQFITRNPDGSLATILTAPVNSNTIWARGLDLEASYHTALSAIHDSWDGDLSFRLVATHVISLKDQGTYLSISTGSIGGGGLLGTPAPSWNGTLTATYSNDPVRFTWSEQYVSPGSQLADIIACTTSCPTPVPTGLQTMDFNHIQAYYLTNLSMSYTFLKDGNRNAEVYLNVDNAFNRNPPPVAQSGVAYAPETAPSIYDTYGRAFRLGVRFKM